MVLGPKRADMSKLRWEDTFMLLSHDGSSPACTSQVTVSHSTYKKTPDMYHIY